MEMDGFLQHSPHLWRCCSERKNLMHVTSLMFIGNGELNQNNIWMMFVKENEWDLLRNQEGCRRWWKFNGNSGMWLIFTRRRENSINSEQMSLVLICLWFKTQFNSFFFLFFFLFFDFSSLFDSAFFALLVILCFCVKEYRRKQNILNIFDGIIALFHNILFSSKHFDTENSSLTIS